MAQHYQPKSLAELDRLIGQALGQVSADIVDGITLKKKSSSLSKTTQHSMESPQTSPLAWLNVNPVITSSVKIETLPLVGSSNISARRGATPKQEFWD